MNNNHGWVVIGRFGRPHGVKGYISVYSFTDPRENILSYADWHVSINGRWTLLKRLSTQEHTRFIVALIDGYSEREQVAQLTNLDIAIESSQLPKLGDGEYYWHQLQGMRVTNTKGVLLGTVTDIIATGSNDVLVVTGESRHLIPYRFGVVVLDISESERHITVDWDSEYL